MKLRVMLNTAYVVFVHFTIYDIKPNPPKNVTKCGITNDIFPF